MIYFKDYREYWKLIAEKCNYQQRVTEAVIQEWQKTQVEELLEMQRRNEMTVALRRIGKENEEAVALRTQQDIPSIEVTVTTVTGKKLVISVHPEDTILKLKNEIQDQEGVHPSQQKLIFGTNSLGDDQTISAYGIVDGAPVYLLLVHRCQTYFWQLGGINITDLEWWEEPP